MCPCPPTRFIATTFSSFYAEMTFGDAGRIERIFRDMPCFALSDFSFLLASVHSRDL